MNKMGYSSSSSSRPNNITMAPLLLAYCLSLLVLEARAFSSPYHSAAATRRRRRGSLPVPHSDYHLKGLDARSSQFGHRSRRPFFAVAEHEATASTISDGTKKTKGSSNSTNKINKEAQKKRYNKNKNKYTTSNKKQQHSKQPKKSQTKQTQTQRRKSSVSRPYSDLTTDELKQLTEYHLSQNIQPYNGTIMAGNMTSAEMHEFSRLLSSWSKLPDYYNSKNSNNNNHLSSQNNNGAYYYSKRQTNLLAAEMAEQCLRELIEEYREGNTFASRVLTADMYYLVIKAWVRVGGYKDLVHASSLLELMERMHGFRSSVKKNHGESSSGKSVNSDEGGSDNNKMKDKFMASSIKCYAAVLDGWCKSKYTGAEVKAEELLIRMGSIDDGRDVRQYNNVMNRIATSGKANAGEEAERLLNELIAFYKQDCGGGESKNNKNKKQQQQLAPNRNSFNTVIKAYANGGGGSQASNNAQRILQMMEDPSTVGLQELGLEISPDKISYTSILLSFANTNISNNNNGKRRVRGGNTAGGTNANNNDIHAGERAEELLARMVDMYETSGNMGVKPDTVTYNAVLKVWGKCGHPDAGERSEAILNKMLELYEAGNIDVVPDDVSFNTVMHNIANSNTVNSPRRAMRLLERMEQSYESGFTAKPDIISYNSVLNAFAKCGGPESARRAEEMLDNLEKSYDSGVWNIRPDVYSYNIVISAWGNCGDANRAVALLDRMTARTNEGRADLKPDATTYNSVLHAWSQSTDRNAPVKALGLLEIMLRLHEGGDRSANPDVLSFSTVINAFSKSKFPRKARQTRDLLRRMKSLYDKGQENMRPNVYVYAAVLNACAYTFGRAEEKEEALQIGIETYEELQRSPDIETNHVAYGSFVRVCRRLMPDDAQRDDQITRAFRQCCADGQLGEYMLRQLRPMHKVYTSLLQEYIADDGDENYDVSIDDLPMSWTCNVKEGRRKRNTDTRIRSGRRK